MNDPASSASENPAPAPESVPASAETAATAPDFKRKAVALKFHLVLLAIVIAAVLLRILMSMQVVATDPFAYDPPDVTDMATYHALSRAILNGQWPAEFVYQPFYYAVFLPSVKLLTYSEYLGPAIAQALCVGVIVWCAGLSAAMLSTLFAGLVAAFLCAFSTMLFFYVPFALIEIQQAMWFSFLFYFTLRGMQTGRLRFFALAGLTLSFAILSRGNAWCFLPAVVFAFAVALRQKRFPTRGKAVLAAVLCLAAIILPQVPFAVHNTRATHSLSGPSTAGPAVLTLGNNPESPPGGLPIPYPPTYDEWMEHAFERSIPHRMWDWFRAEPLAFAVLQAEKFFLFFDSHEIPNNIQLGYNAQKSSIFRMFGLFPTGLIVALALAGFFLNFTRLKERPGELLLYLFIFLYAFATMAFYVLARFRVPAIPFFAIAAGVFLSDLVVTALDWRTNMRHLLLHCVPALLAGAYFVWLFYPMYREYYEAPLMRAARPDGVRLKTAASFQEFDNGPEYLSPWMAARLDAATTVSKSFSASDIDPRDYSEAYVTAVFCMESPGEFSAVCNGKLFRLTAAPDDLHPLPYLPVRIGPLPVPDDLTFSFTFPGLPPDRYGLAVDFHRDYGRTVYNAKAFPAEAVMRLELVHADDPRPVPE